MLFLGGSLFLDDEQILFIDGEQILFIDVCRLLLSLNNSWTININLFSMSTWKQLTKVTNQLAIGNLSSKVDWWDMEVELVVTE